MTRITCLFALLILSVSSVFYTPLTTASEFSAVPFEQQTEILPVDEAFSLQVVRQANTVEVLWQIRPGHYLYRHSLGLSGSERVGKPSIPDGLQKQDEYFGDVEVYYDALIVEASLEGDIAEEIVIQYQGCSDAGICYPPQKRVIEL